MLRSLKGLVGGALLAAAGTSGALAQNFTNETWLGQVGGTNTIIINQSGRNNQAGADNVDLRVDQDGDRNLLDINQYGHHNRVGAEPSTIGPTGIKQIGSENVVDIDQRTAEDAYSGGNAVDAVYQSSPAGREEAANILVIFQSNDGGHDGTGTHRVGTVQQIYLGSEGAANSVSISQVGGGLGEGNRVGDVLQEGAANVFILEQRNQLNRVNTVRQLGTGNNATVHQELLSGIVGGNLVDDLLQYGASNTAQVRMAGSSNAIERIEQNNRVPEGVLGIGNDIRITLDGEGNGSNGNGQVGDFLSEAALAIGAAQANIVQIGENNRATITITGIDNRFGSQQFGDDNDVIISIGSLDGSAANGNESAIFQDGTDNVFSHVVLGSGNVGAVRQSGNFNRLEIEQRGKGNFAQALVTGHRNNLEGVNSSFTNWVVSALLGLPDIKPGRLHQDGLDNQIRVTVTGSDNRFGFHQHGDFNRAESTIIGSGNQVAVAQLGNDNVALSAQYGNGNSVVIRQ